MHGLNVHSCARIEYVYAIIIIHMRIETRNTLSEFLIYFKNNYIVSQAFTLKFDLSI